MSCWRRSIRPAYVDFRGFSTAELLIGTLLTALAVTATSGFFLASSHQLRYQLYGIETAQAARSVADTIVRDLRQSGACLPDTGRFIALEGTDSGDRDEIVTRTGLVQPASCVRTSLRQAAAAGAQTLYVEQVDGFQSGMRVYLRNADGDGEYGDISSIDTTESALVTDHPLATGYLKASGVYAVSERRFYVSDATTAQESIPQLMMQVDGGEPTPFAAGIEKLDFTYQLARNCPPCDTVDLPNGDQEWSSVEQVFLTVTARSEATDGKGEPYRRTIRLGVRPRNLRPR